MMDPTERKMEYGLLNSNLSGADCALERRIFSGWRNTGVAPGIVNFDDPRQGSCNDCYFIAALISVAFAAKASLKIYPNYRFYKTTGGYNDFAINADLAVDATGKLVYARSKNNDKTWPGLYEKAYAMWLNNDLGNNHPNMAKLCGGGNGLTALQNITGIVPVKNQMPPFLANGNAQYPAVAQSRDVPTHTYSVIKRIGGVYTFKNPCGGGTINVTEADLPLKFGEWGYIKTA
ncbi:MAG: C2 family cysteine protease [Methanoregulaceae archaeon]|jgi:hypothetical protein|nr:C2 family cysteine protease [Methanoregulaceae archaeon]